MNYQPRSTNPYIMEKKLNECVGGGGLDPSVLEEIESEISVLGSENATMAQDIIDIKGSLNSINDNLSGFKYYPTGTGIVGLIADDSAYTDADGNYVIWGTETAEQLVEDNPNTYKSVPSTEDCRGEVGADTASPFKSKLKPIKPINPSKQLSRYIIRAGSTGTTFDNCWNSGCMMPILGYKQFHIYANANQYIGDGFCFRFLDESLNVVGSYYNFSGGSWKSYDIPSNAVYVEAGLKYASHSTDYEPYYYSLN